MKKNGDLYGAEGLYHLIGERRDALARLIVEKKKALQNYPENIPPGKVKAVASGKNRTRVQYFHRNAENGSSYKYIKKSEENKKMVRMMIQREYDRKVLAAAESEYNYLKRAEKFSDDSLLKAFVSMGKLKQSWIAPVVCSDEVYVNSWKSREYSPQPVNAENQIFVTKQNERVRSKSELFIANALFDYGVPYYYEMPLRDRNGPWVLPDFTVLNVRRKKQYYWEHFGMIGNAEYTDKALKKIRDYERHGLYQGREVIFTFESQGNPIDTNAVKNLIQKFLL